VLQLLCVLPPCSHSFFFYFKLLPRCLLGFRIIFEQGLWRCGAQTEGCCKYYHRSCLRKWHSSLGLPLSSSGGNVCPRHNFCGRGDQCPVINAASPRKSSNSKSSDTDKEGKIAQESLSWRCLRCPVAYHSRFDHMLDEMPF